MTYNQWVNLFEQFATANQFIKGFYHGHISLRHSEKDIQYPFMHLMYMNSSYTLQAETVVFEVLFMDLPVKKHFELEMETEILSDMKQSFEQVKHIKPKASRAESVELYVLATGFRGKSATANREDDENDT